MTRSSFRKFWFLSVLVMLGMASYAHNKSEELGRDVARVDRTKDRLTRELRMGNQMTSALFTLDERTIDAKNVTRLSLLRFLGIEESPVEFLPQQPGEIAIGPAKLITRKFIVRGSAPYADAFEQLDQFYNSGKSRIERVKMEPAKKAYGDVVSYELQGVIYGLHK